MAQEKHIGYRGHSDGEVFVKEWLPKNQFNSFNTWKGLLYADWYKTIASGVIPIPVEARIDTTLRCNLECRWCNSARYRHKMEDLPTEHYLKLIDFCADWGIKAVLWAGGGEPTMYPGIGELLMHTKSKGMETALLTNCTTADPMLLSIMGETCRWIGVSVDVGSASLYKLIKGADRYHQVIKNIRYLSEHYPDCGTSYKFLLAPQNQKEIYTACLTAKEIGVREFVVRPADFSHQGMKTSLAQYKLDTVAISDQFEMCHRQETDEFRVFTVTHKFAADLKQEKKQFSQCYAAPLKLQCAPDGNVYFCDDQFFQPKYLLGTHYPDVENIRKFWGGEKHKKLVYGGTPDDCATRCCVGPYCIQCERLFVNNDDPMCWRFP